MSLPIVESIIASTVFSLSRFLIDRNNPKWRRGLAIRFLYAMPVCYFASKMIKKPEDVKLLFFGILTVFYSEVLEKLFLHKPSIQYIRDDSEEEEEEI